MTTLPYLIEAFKVDPTRCPCDVPGWTRDDLPRLFAELGFTEGAEIGVWQGEFSEKFCAGIPNLHHRAIDPWTPFADYRDIKSVARFEDAHQQAVTRLAPYHCDILRMTSLEAAQQIPDKSLDFVYIDGNHSFGHCAMDLHVWSRKVRAEGIVAGHDFYFFDMQKTDSHVVEAVHGFTASYRIAPWFVLGTRQESKQFPEHDSNRYRSFLWVQP